MDSDKLMTLDEAISSLARSGMRIVDRLNEIEARLLKIEEKQKELDRRTISHVRLG